GGLVGVLVGAVRHDLARRRAPVQRGGRMRYVRLLRIFIRTELQFALEYRANLALGLVEEVVIVTSSLLAVLVLDSRTAAINGWTLDQMIVLLGVYYLVQGAQAVVFETSFERFMEHVRMG